MGPVEYFEVNHNVVLDLLGALWYSTHIAVVLGFTLFLWWSQRRSAQNERPTGDLARFLWGFLALNLVGFTIQVLFPVAPPWYISEFGNVMPGPGTLGDPAGLARVDALFGGGYFAGIYGQASYVFGAMPSLHVAYPVWIALNTRSAWGRVLGWSYASAMAFFAVYLTHHYILDVLAGAAISTTVYVLFRTTALGKVPQGIYQWLAAQFLVAKSKSISLAEIFSPTNSELLH